MTGATAAGQAVAPGVTGADTTGAGGGEGAGTTGAGGGVCPTPTTGLPVAVGAPTVGAVTVCFLRRGGVSERRQIEIEPSGGGRKYK